MTKEDLARLVPEAFETERLLIRAPHPGDGREMNKAILETYDELHAWMPWAQEKPTVRQSETIARQGWRAFQERSDLPYRIFLKGSGTLVGASGLHRFDWSVPCLEIGYWSRKSYQGHGYITETVRGLTAVAFDVLQAERVEIRCDARNIPSRRVAERAGYILEGELRHNSRAPDGSLRNTLLFGMIHADYAALRESYTRGITGLPSRT
jgi:RimJ/RimL family protein N-acetyltransferase